MRVMIVVTHLLGTGHLARAAALAIGVARDGGDALLVSGGRRAPHLTDRAERAGVRLAQPPSVASDGVDFSRLLDETGAAATEALMAARAQALIDALESFRPDVVVTELFPFGRRVLAAEFLALLEAASAATPRPAVVASVRDVLAPPSTEKKAAATAERLRRFYDGVLAHSDPAVARLNASWPVSPAIEAMLHYTGYVAPAAEDGAFEDDAGEDGRDEILVSAGGGSVGAALFEAAADAASMGAGEGRRWRLLVGGSDRATRIEALRRRVGANAPIAIEAVRPDFRALLGRAALSVNQAGYNTMLDIVGAGVRSVIAPFEEGGETEQRQRAAAFAERFGFVVVPEAALDGDRLAAAAATAQTRPKPIRGAIRLDGVAESVRAMRRVHAAMR